MSTQALSFRDTTVMIGDSITAGTPNPWYKTAVDTINSQFQTTTKPYAARSTGSRAAVGGSRGSVTAVAYTPTMNVINSGIAGNQISDISTNIAARITNYNPTAVVSFIGINDCITFNTTLSAFRTAYDAIWAAVLAHNPSCKLWAVSLYAWGELFNSGPIWANPFDGPPAGSNNGAGLTIPDYNASAKSSVEAAGGIFVEARNEALALIASLSSPPGNHVGPTTLDGLHPNAQYGQPLISTQWLSTVQVVTV